MGNIRKNDLEQVVPVKEDLDTEEVKISVDARSKGVGAWEEVLDKELCRRYLNR